jgi:hypothetical protein
MALGTALTTSARSSTFKKKTSSSVTIHWAGPSKTLVTSRTHILITQDYFEDPLVVAVGRTVKLQEGEARRAWMVSSSWLKSKREN